jgi:hypothetical protein
MKTDKVSHHPESQSMAVCMKTNMIFLDSDVLLMLSVDKNRTVTMQCMSSDGFKDNLYAEQFFAMLAKFSSMVDEFARSILHGRCEHEYHLDNKVERYVAKDEV